VSRSVLSLSLSQLTAPTDPTPAGHQAPAAIAEFSLMPNQASPASVPTVTPAHDSLAPDLVALFLGATPHPDIVIPEPKVTIAELAAAARAEGLASAGLKWDAARQRFAS
jgi:hypothetical protein